MLRAEHIYKTYNAGNKIALNDFSIHIPKGSIYGLLGPNGAGKTSFIRIINQITMPDSGHIFIDGQELNINHIKDIGYMPEERGLYKNMKIGEQLIYLGAMKGMSKKDAQNQAKQWFERLNIDQWWNKKLAELSKGMAQKIQFVVTVLHRPKLLILDEPFSGFDPLNTNLIKDQIIDLKNKGTTIILSTHRMESVEEMCDYVALVNQSKKILDGKVMDVRKNFKQNIYQVILSGVNQEIFENFRKKYLIKEFKFQNKVLNFDIQGNFNQKELLEDLLKIGTIQNFGEKIPSMNEVFINAVQNNK